MLEEGDSDGETEEEGLLDAEGERDGEDELEGDLDADGDSDGELLGL